MTDTTDEPSPDQFTASMLDQIWSALLQGDPGPAVAFVDMLTSSDFSYAAGGFVRDLAERLHDAPKHIEDPAATQQFTNAIRETLDYAHDGDQQAVQALLTEVSESSRR